MGIEPTHKGFADLSLTTWVPRLNVLTVARSAAKIYQRLGAEASAAAYRGLQLLNRYAKAAQNCDGLCDLDSFRNGFLLQ